MPGRKSRRSGGNTSGWDSSKGALSEESIETAGYESPLHSGESQGVETSDGALSAADTLHANTFVTQPPRPRQGLTGKISTLFRRESSKERSSGRSPAGSPSSPKDNNDPKILRGSRSSLAGSVASVLGVASSSSQKTGPMPASSPTSQTGGEGSKRSSSSSARKPRSRSRSRGASNDDDRSVSTTTSAASKRIFYSSNADDDSDDSYASRVSRSSRGHKGTTTEEEEGYTSRNTGSMTSATTSRTIVRYRGFSTSIKSLFLDETVVCASMGCFGLILSNRTEYLLQLRNERRGALSPRKSQSERKKLPSRIVAYGLLVTILLMFCTFVVWGFGSGNGLAASYYPEYYEDYNNQQQENNAWDDYLQNNDNRDNNNDNNYNDDNLNENEQYWQNNQNQYDDGVQQDDNYNNWNYGDDYNKNNNNYNNYQYNNDDGGNDDGNQNGNDDGVYNQNNYNQNNYNQYNNNQYNYNQYNYNQYNNNQYNGDDGGGNDDANAGGDDYYEANDDGGRRRAARRRARHPERAKSHPEEATQSQVPHPVHGIFKLRDCQESVWDPVYEFLVDEWYRVDPRRAGEKNQSLDGSSHRWRRRNEEDGSSSQQDSLTDKTRKDRDLASNTRIALLFAFLLFLGVLGRRRRMRTRFYLVRARAQEDHLFYASTEVGQARRINFDDTREDQYEGACSHTLCGCYPVDEVVDQSLEEEEVEVTDVGIFKRKRKPHHEDFVARAFNCVSATCCGLFCKCWFQCLSICALAQEAREVRLLVPPRYQRIDYITHQPFHEFQKDVNDLRRGWLGKTRKKSGLRPHLNALSRLSRYIIVTFILAFVVIVATLIFNPRAAFSWQDAVVLVATFLQAFLVLFVVHWIFHKSDLSLDAVVKMFAAGFVIAVPSAFFFEGLLVNIVLFFAWAFYEICAMIGGQGFVSWVFEHWRAIWIAGELFNAYVVAAVTEELCKYYTFRTIEHPDLVFLTGLNREAQDEQAVEGGLVKYPFASHQVQKLNRNNSYDTQTNRSHRSSPSKKSGRSSRLIEKTGTREDEFDEDQNDVRTYRQKAMAITTGMISVAVGLACAENFLYVFVLGGATQSSSALNDEESYRSDVLEEWIVLFFRSIFPIHALAAALQSINMIRKFVEADDQNGHRIGVGRIILPAVLVHGSFDAVLMGINVFQETAWDRYLSENEGNIGDEGPYNTFVVNLVAWVGISLVMLAGLGWYYRENRNQRLRLKILEEKDRARTAEHEEAWKTNDLV